MGQQVSKEIRSRLEYQTLEELLFDDKYVEKLGQCLPGLPKPSHNNLTRILASWENASSKVSHSKSELNRSSKGQNLSVKDKNSRAYKLRSLWSIQSQDINIPQNVAEVLKQNYRSLLRLSSTNCSGFQSPSDYYEYTCNVETDRILCKILWRFLTTFYYDLISELDATELRHSTNETGGVAFVVAVICQSGKHDREIVRAKVLSWASIGRRYRGFMHALCSGCLFLLPEKTKDLVWEQYIPRKGETFAKVIQFLRDLGIVRKCEEEGWNDLSDQILQALREPFRSVIPFQFQPNEQSQFRSAPNQAFELSPGDVDIHRREQPLPRQGASRVIKSTRKKATASVRRQLQNLVRDVTPHQEPHTQLKAHVEDSQLPQASVQVSPSTLNECGQQMTTNHVAGRLLPPQLHAKNQLRQSPTDMPLNTTQVYELNGQQGQVRSISEISRFGRPGIKNISSLLNQDSSASAMALSVTQNSPPSLPNSPIELGGDTTGRHSVLPAVSPGTPSVHTTSLGVIQFEKELFQRVIVDRPSDIMGDIWFGSLPGFAPFVSLRLSEVLGDIFKPSGRKTFISSPAPDANKIIEGVYSIKLELFMELIQRDGFGGTYWNETEGVGFVSIEVLDKQLIADFFHACEQTIGGLPVF